jgi:hypothetical protein
VYTSEEAVDAMEFNNEVVALVTLALGRNTKSPKETSLIKGPCKNVFRVMTITLQDTRFQQVVAPGNPILMEFMTIAQMERRRHDEVEGIPEFVTDSEAFYLEYKARGYVNSFGRRNIMEFNEEDFNADEAKAKQEAHMLLKYLRGKMNDARTRPSLSPGIPLLEEGDDIAVHVYVNDKTTPRHQHYVGSYDHVLDLIPGT